MKKRRVIYMTDEEWDKVGNLAFNMGESKSGALTALVLADPHAHPTDPARKDMSALEASHFPPGVVPAQRTWRPVPKPSKRKT